MLAHFCAAPASTFDDNCIDGTHGAMGAVNTARKNLAFSCRTGSNTGCGQFIGGNDEITVAACTANPYLITDGCDENEAFATERTRFAMCADATDDPFNGLCDIESNPATQESTAISIRKARGTVCVGLSAAERITKNCGDEITPDDYIRVYCQEEPTAANNHRDCPTTAYKNENPNLGASDDVSLADFNTSNKNQPLNAEGTALLTGIIATGEADESANPKANFIVGDSAGLSLGTSATTNPANTPARDLKLDDATDGFAIVSAGATGERRHYVGILSGTNLGNPVTNSVNGTWTGKISLTRDTDGGDFNLTLTVNIGAKTIEQASTQVALGSFGTINIDGKFTANGVIYGTVDFGGDTSTATLTGLIGTDGAVGIFASNSAATSAYVGGFVAEKFDSGPDCKKDVDPFNSICGENANAQIAACTANNGTGNMQATGGAGFEMNCSRNSTVTSQVCAASGNFANPFYTAICTTNQAQRQLNFVNNCDQGKEDGANCPASIPLYTCLAKPFGTGCEAAEFTDVRSSAVTLCTADMKPFDAKCEGYSQETANQNSYCLSTETEGDGLCKNGTVDYTLTICAVNSINVFAKVCTTANRIAFCTTGTTNIFDERCASTPGVIEETKTAREAACADSAQGAARAMDNQCTATVLRICDTEGKVFNSACLRTVTGAAYQSDRLLACEIAITGALPANNGCFTDQLSGMICGTDETTSGSNPFADICKSRTQNVNHANLDIAKQISCGSARLSGGATNKDVCDTLQDGLCTGANSVSDAMQGAGNFVCSGDNEPNVVMARKTLCETPADTYTTGCKTEHGSEVLTVRDTLALACVLGGDKYLSTSSGRDTDCDQAVDASGTKVGACSDNPYLAACEVTGVKEAFATVLSNRNTLCISSEEPSSDPFDGLCDVFTGGDRNIVTQRTAHCGTSKTNPWDAKCEDSSLVTVTDAAIAEARTNVCLANTRIDATVTQALFDTRCAGRANLAGMKVTDTRRGFCNADIVGLRGAGGTPALCNDADLSGAICGTGAGGASVAGSNPFAPICTESSGAALLAGFDADIARAALALTCRTTNAPNCAAKITGTSIGTSFRDCSLNPYFTDDNCHTNEAFATEREARETLCTTVATSFDSLCDIVTATKTDLSTLGGSVAIQIARGRGCLDSVTGATGCGAEDDDSGDYVDVYCNNKGITDIANCPLNYVSQNSTVVTNVSVPAIGSGENQLLTSDGKDPLTIITTAVGANGENDADANFIEGGANALTLVGDSTAATTETPLTLDGVGIGTDANDGFAFTIGTFNGNVTKLYVGLLSGTGLGAPVDNGDQVGEWAAKTIVLTSAGASQEVGFILVATFNDNSDNTLAVKDSFDVGSLGAITINGKFTANGVIYGTVNFATAGTATLSGLIGQSGAVGIFASDTAATTDYVGGFVAAPEEEETVIAINCNADGVAPDPFHATCTSLANYNLQAQLCANNEVTAVTTFGDATFNTNCQNNIEVTNRVCTTSGTYANPFDAAICETAGDQVANQQGYCSNGDNTWQARCTNVADTASKDIETARANACIANTAITTSNPGDATAIMIDKPLFNSVCINLPDTDKSITAVRLPLCSGALMGLTDAGGTPALCKNDDLSGAICGTSGAAGSNPFAPICYDTMALVDGFSEMNAKSARSDLATTCLTPNADTESMRVCALSLDGVSSTTTLADCSANPYLMTDNCHTNEAFMGEREARLTLCTTAADSFNALCNIADSNYADAATTDYTDFDLGDVAIARGRGCLDSVTGATGCGDEDTSGNYIYAYCQDAGITNLAECPKTYTRLNATVVTDVTVPGIGTGENQLLNADGSDALTIIGENDAHATNDADANFIAVSSTGQVAGTTPAGDGPLALNVLNGSDDANSGFAFASASSKLYVGLLDGTALGAPVDNGNQVGEWAGMITVLTSTGAVMPVGFTLVANFNDNSDNTLAIKETALAVGSLGTISINGKFTNNGVIYGTVNFTTAGAGTLSGLIGQSGAVGIFASNVGESTAYVGGFVAAPAPVSTTCDTSIPFSHADCDPVADAAARLAEANRCYNNGGAVQTGGDCDVIRNCLARNASGLFSDETLVGATDNRVACSSAAFAGARANYCGGNNIDGSLCKDLIALNNAEAACLNNPFADGCGVSLGADVAVTARTARVDYCVGQAAQTTTTTAVGSPCAAVLMYCSDTTRSGTPECASSATGKTALIPAFCVVFRNLGDAVCDNSAELAKSCTDNPFDTFCTDNVYITAQRNACGADNYNDNLGPLYEFNQARLQRVPGERSNTEVNADNVCGTHTATLCAESGTNANPFAPICETAINTNVATITTTQQNFCRADGILEANLSDCGGVASTFCATAGTNNAVAFDNLCREATYDVARVKACGAGTPDTSTYTGNGFTDCNTLVADLCPEGGGVRNPGCPVSGDTVTTASWTSLLSGAGAVQNDGSTRLTVLPVDGVNQSNLLTNYVVGTADGLNLGFDQSVGNTLSNINSFASGGLKLSDLDSVDGSVGDTDGVSFATFANSAGTKDTVPGGSDGTAYNAQRYYAGLWSDTDLGAPLNSTEQSATWDGKIRLYALSTLYNTDDFKLEVVFGGTDGNTLIARDISVGTDFFTINGKFTSAGVIYGTTSFGFGGSRSSTGSLTGLIGVEGAVGAFVSTTDIENDFGAYVGGFVAALSDEEPEPVFNCETDGTPFDLVNCPTAGDVRAMLCSNGMQGSGDCNTETIANAVCVSSGTQANPFADFCATENTRTAESGMTNAVIQQAVLDTCGLDNTNDAMAVCANSLMERTTLGTTCVATNAVALFTPECNYTQFAQVKVNFCEDSTGTNPFNEGCNAADYDDERTVACLADRMDTASTDRCPGLITGFCADTTSDLGENPFHARCINEANNLANRLTVCGAGGEQRTCFTLLANNCPETGTRAKGCPVVTNTASWARDAVVVGSDGEKKSLAGDIIAAGGATHANTKDANFIVGGTSDLNLNAREYGRLYDDIEEDGQTLKDFDGIADDSAIGFSIQAAFFESTAGCRDRGDCVDDTIRSFVGLLSGTNLGAPLSSNEQSGTWAANLSLLVGGGSVFVETGFKLKVDFGAKSIQVVDGSDEETVVSLIHTQFSNANLAIRNGKFTENGIIHGTTNLFAFATNRAGTLTGLIGEKGAVAVFKSNEGEPIAYVGGFVAAPDCKATAGFPFSVACTDNVTEQRTFVNGCNGNPMKDGCDESITGVDGGTTINECIANPYNFECGGRTGAFSVVLAARNDICGYGRGTNPFDPLCNDHPSQNVNQQNFCGESREGYSSQKATDCAPLITRICAGSNSVLTRVGAGEYNCSKDDEFASDREIECGATDPAGDPVCQLVIASVCTGTDAFESAAGGGGYPCAGDSTVDGARDAYCRTTTTVGDSLCAGARMTKICLAGDTPFSLLCGANDGTKNIIERGKACALSSDPAALSNHCGDEDTGYIASYCDTAAGDNNVAHCPNTYAVDDSDADIVDASDLVGKALNADGTGLERVVATGRANPTNDDRANFIEGSFSGVSLGNTHINGGARTATFRLNPNALNTTDEYRSGFSVAQATVRTAITDARQGKTGETYDHYYYVSVLSNTNLGAPLPATADDGATTLEWSAQLRFMFGVNVQAPQDFTLMVDLSDQTISGSARGLLGFDIDGNFTDTGLIYGRFVSNVAGAGTLSGLIGERGAVGIFKSNPGSAVYIGGFLADGSGNCTTTGTPFNADCKGNIDQRAQLCLAWKDGLPGGATVADDCAGDPAITALICADNGEHANPFDSEICLGNQDGIQTAFINNCRGNSANGANCSRYTDCVANPYRTRCDATDYVQERIDYTTLVDNCRKSITTGDACNAYNSCVENPYQTTCYAVSYHVERANYANQFVESCLGVTKMDVPVVKPVGAPASCTDALAQVTICSNSGEYANPFNTAICAGYDDLATIQSEFATMCYNIRADLRNNPECENIATCFASDKLGIASMTSTAGGIACDSAAFNDVVTARNTLASCDGQVSGADLISGCLQPTITEVCNTNPFSVVANGKGIDCLSDTALNDLRERVCINDYDNPAYSCSTTETRVCVTEDNPFSDLCYDNITHDNTRYTMCSAIDTQITPNTARTNEDNLLQNCLDTVDYECQYGGIEQFTNRFCLIGTLYDVDRGRACLYGYDMLQPDGTTTNVVPSCSGDTTYVAAYCNANPLDTHSTCTDTVKMALSCAEDSMGAGCDTVIVSDTLTINDCNANPFADGCESPAFINARLESCKENDPHPDCSVAEGQDLTNYVAGTEDGLKGLEEAIYVQDVEETTLNESYAYVQDDLSTPTIHEGAAYVKGIDGRYVVAMETVEVNCRFLNFRADSRVCDNEMRPVADRIDTPIDESRVRVANNPDTDVDESKIRITEDDGNTYVDERIELVQGAVAESLTLAHTSKNGDDTSGFVIAYVPTGRDTNTGVAGTDRYYAGFLSNTNVGRAENIANGKWTAQLAIINDGGAAETADFTLDVDFGTKTIGASSGTTIAPLDYVAIAGGQFTIAGKFTEQGVIYGTTRLSDGQLNGESSRGSLTGAIGAKGAVGAFVSSGEGATVNTLGEFAGGFVATNPDYVFVAEADGNGDLVDYSDWARNQESLSLTAKRPLRNQFLGTADSIQLDEEGAGTVTNTGKETITLAGDTDSGFAIFNNSKQFYAGILAGTNLGAPLMDGGGTLTWKGAFRTIGTYRDSTTGRPREEASFRRTSNFELEITFGADSRDVVGSVGSIEAFQQIATGEAANRYYLIEGTFDASGYITGTVNLGAFTNGDRTTTRASNGILTGLIGKNGAVGTFISNPIDTSITTGEHAFAYNGGFAVAPPPTLPKYSTFVEFYGARSDTRELHATHPATTDGGRFIEGTETGLVTANFNLTGKGYGPAVVRLGEVASDHADYDSGFAVMRSHENRYRVGLLSGTDLGAALDSTVTANWSGKIYRLTHTINTGDALTSDDLTLTVDFADGTIETADTTVRGRFNTGSVNTDLPFGILDGTVNYGGSNVLAGLIGDKGVLGVFHGEVLGAHAGGFWAKPDVEKSVSYTFATEATTYSHWTAALTGTDEARNPQLASGSAAGGFGNNQYITLEDMTNDIKVIASGTIVQDDLMLDGSAVSGVVFGVHPDNGQSFVSLLPTTNVGGAITGGPANAKWAGSLRGITTFGDGTLSSDNFELEVAFGARTIKTLNRFNTDIAGPTAITKNEYGTITNPSFNVNGNFDANGVMWGDVALGDNTNGVFSGLIGQNGAVGAFRGEDGNGGYAGGFQVKPPSGN